MTKKIVGLMCAILTLTSISITKVNAAKYIEYPVAVGTVDNFKPELPGNDAQSAYLCDYNSGTVVYAKNENDRRPIASMTKIMLLLLAFEKEATGELSLDENIKISPNASGMGGSQVFLEANKQCSARYLFFVIFFGGYYRKTALRQQTERCAYRNSQSIAFFVLKDEREYYVKNKNESEYFKTIK